MSKIRLKDLQFHELQDLLQSMGWEKFRAKQIFFWLYKTPVKNHEDMANLPKNLREELADKTQVFTLSLDSKCIFVSHKDGTFKFVSHLEDNIGIETAVMKYKYGNTVCISSQAGCNMQCAFCASARGGKKRDLTPGEMIDQVVLAEELLPANNTINNIVIMGIGEPLENYDNMRKFIQLANDSKGLNIGMRKITISTCGLVPYIYQLAEDNAQVNLAVSLHAPTNSLRTKLVPLNKKYPLGELLAACEAYYRLTHRKVTFEYILMNGVNDGISHADKLAKLLNSYNFLFHVNIIPYNPVGGSLFESPSHEKANNFLSMLQNNGVSATLRKEKGTDIEGACGQLSTRIEG